MNITILLMLCAFIFTQNNMLLQGAFSSQLHQPAQLNKEELLALCTNHNYETFYAYINVQKKEILALADSEYQYPDFNPLHAVFLNKENVSHCYSIFESLILCGFDVNRQDQTGKTPLQIAVELQEYNLISMFLDYEADPNIQDHNGDTPLLIAAKKYDIRAIQQLLAIGADASIVNKHGQSAYTEILFLDNQSMLNLLEDTKPFYEYLKHLLSKSNRHALTKKSLLFRSIHSNGNSFLQESIECNDLDVARLILLEKIIDVNQQNKDGETALHLAIKKQDPTLVSELLIAGSNVFILNKDGKTALDIALDIQSKLHTEYPEDIAKHISAKKIIYRLIEKQILMLCKNKDFDAIIKMLEDPRTASICSGNSFLRCALEYQNIDMIYWLLKQSSSNTISIDLNAKSKAGVPPIQTAIRLKFHNALYLLLQCKAHVNATDNHGNTPLHVAIEQQDSLATWLIMIAKPDLTILNENKQTPLQLLQEKYNTTSSLVEREALSHIKTIITGSQQHPCIEQKYKYEVSKIHASLKKAETETNLDKKRKKIYEEADLFFAWAPPQKQAKTNDATSKTELDTKSSNDQQLQIPSIEFTTKPAISHELSTEERLKLFKNVCQEKNLSLILEILYSIKEKPLDVKTFLTSTEFSDALPYFFKHDMMELFIFFEEASINIHQTPFPLLHLAVFHKSYNIFEYLIQHNYNINEIDHRGNTPLHIAVLQKTPFFVDRLLAKFADRTIKNNDNKTAEDLSSKDPRKLECVCTKTSFTPVALIQLQFIPLLDDIERIVSSDQASHNLVQEQDIRYRATLFQQQDAYNMSILDHILINQSEALSFNHITKIIDYIISHKIVPHTLESCVDAQNQDQETALHHAVKKQNYELVHYLMLAGASVTIKNAKGLTPLALAQQKVKDMATLPEEEKYKKISREILDLLCAKMVEDQATARRSSRLQATNLSEPLKPKILNRTKATIRPSTIIKD